MAISEELRIEIVAEAQKAVKEISKTEKATAKLGSTLTKVFTAGALVAGTKKLISLGKEFSELASIQEAAVVRLNAALEATGQMSDTTSNDLQAFASELQQLSVVGDEVSLGLMQSAINMGLSADQAKVATKQAIALSRAYGIDLNTAMIGVVNTMQGQTSTLTRYIPALKSATNETERLQILNEEATKAWAVATKEIESHDGILQQYQNTLGDTKELMGQTVNDGLDPFLEKLTEALQKHNEFVAKINEQNAASEAVASGVATVAQKIIRIEQEIEKEKINLLTAFDEASKTYHENEIQRLENRIVSLRAEQSVIDFTNDMRAESAELADQQAAKERAIADAIAARQAIADNAYLAISDGLQLIATKETTALLTGEEYNATLERRKLVLGEIETLNEQGFSAQSGAIQYIIRLYGDLIEKEQESAEVTQTSYDQALEMARSYYDGVQIMATETADLESQLSQQRISDWSSSLSSYSSYASSFGAIFDELIQREMSGEEELSESKKKEIQKLFRLQQSADLAQIGMDTAAAIMGVWADPGYPAAIPLSVIIGALGVANSALVLSQSPPSYATGGIVPGTSFSGDNVPAMVNSGEMILNPAQQASLWAAANGQGGGGVTVIINGAIGNQEEVAMWVNEGLRRARQMGKVAA